MRLALTVVSPAARQYADVILDAAAQTPVAEVAAALERFAHGGTVRDGTARDGTGPGAYHGAGQGSAGQRDAGAQVLQFPGSRSRGPTALADHGDYSRS